MESGLNPRKGSEPTPWEGGILEWEGLDPGSGYAETFTFSHNELGHPFLRVGHGIKEGCYLN